MLKITRLLSLTATFSFCLQSVAASTPIHISGDLIGKVPARNSLVVPVDGCHANNRYHYVDEIGEEAEHRHRGNSCRVEIRRKRAPEHCHKSGQRHRHRGYGRTTHSHFQKNCEVDVWKQRKNNSGRSERGCIKVGPVLFCP